MNFIEACMAVRAHCPNAYAKSYAEAVLNRSLRQRAEQYGVPVAEAYSTQALYILSNMGGWRGEIAAQVRATLKQAVRD